MAGKVDATESLSILPELPIHARAGAVIARAQGSAHAIDLNRHPN
jgi:hypothetical protein